MSVILLNKNKFNILLKEDLTSGKYNPLNPYRGEASDPTNVVKNLGGDDAGSAKARSEYLRDKIEKNFSELGIPSYSISGYMKAQGIFTLELIQQYSEPFDFSFVKENGEKFSGKATYNKGLSEKFKTLVLDFNGEAKLKFSPESLKRPFLAKPNIWGKYKDKLALMGLQTNGIFDVEISGNLSSKNEESEEEESTDNYNVGDEISFKTDKGENGKGKIIKIEGDKITVGDGKGGEIVINKENITTNTEDEKKGLDEKEGNYYNGKDLKEVNLKLSDLKDKASFFNTIKQYKDDSDFQKIFLDAIINTTKSIKINQKPLLVTLKDLKSNGLLEAPEAMSGLKRKFLKIKLNLQNFMVEVFSLFAKLAKSGKQSKTFEVIKKFYKELFLIATKGKSHISDEQTRKQLWRKLMGSFSNFLKALAKLPEMTKGGKNLEKEKNVKVKNMPKATMGTMESFIQDIANGVKLITEEEKVSFEKIKILKVGILQDLYPDDEDGGKKGKPNQLSNKNFIPCKVDLKFETDEDDTIFNKSTKKQIVDGLSTGKFFVRMTQKPKGLVLIFSKTDSESGSFFTIAGKNIKSPKDPSQWKGEVMVGDKAMGNKDFKGTKAFIKNLVLSK